MNTKEGTKKNVPIVIRTNIVLCMLALMIAFCSCSSQPKVNTEDMEEYKILYELVGGMNDPDNPATYTSASLPITLKNPTKQGCVFQGWLSEALGIKTFTKDVVIPVGTSGDFILYAIWEDDDPTTPDEVVVPEPEKQMIYDFAELNDEDFPRGITTTNQIINKYRDIRELYIHYRREYNVASLVLQFDQIEVFSVNMEPGTFSFYNEDLVTGYYSMSEKDKEVSFEIEGVTIYDAAAKLPRNLKIGQSTKAQVIAAYPEKDPDSYISEKYDLISYVYAFFDEDGNMYEGNSSGPVRYHFDEDGVLEHFEVWWWFSGD